MKTLLTFDYEVFFGRQTGSVERTLLQPAEALAALARKHGVPMVFFVDAGFLLKLREEMRKAPALQADYSRVCRQVEQLARAGHEIQLHIHSHWEDCHWAGDHWHMDVSRYRLHDFPPADIARIVNQYTTYLRELAGPSHAFAYRAGGWVIQPFERLRDALLAAGVRIDSTVFAEGVADGETHTFDFRGAPAASRWAFDADPLQPCDGGPFLEVPIASHPLGATFFWRFALAKKLGGEQHRPFGDGRAIGLSRQDLMRKLFTSSMSVVSMDGYKASFIPDAYRRYQKLGFDDFVMIGHPKSLTPYSLSRLDDFLSGVVANDVVGYAHYLPQLSAARPTPSPELAPVA